jgi:dTDP-4-dehydrorhamnose reductase
MKKILVTGQSSRFVKFLKKELHAFEVFYPTKKNFNLLNFKQINNYIKKKNITHLIHIAGLSRPMDIHEKNISKSIDLNIIGTANIVKSCDNNRIKLIYFSTNYVYPGTSGNYKETDALKPINNYAWSKLGGEAAVHLYKNSLILRICMTDYPFVHKKAISGAFTSFIFNDKVAQIIPFILNEKGILNIGGKKREIYNFAINQADKNIKKISINKFKNFPKDSSLNINKFKNLIKNKKKISL